jgi:hypothetical protein
MTIKVIVIGHSDGDGHLITEQTRRNLSLVDGFEVGVLVDPVRTKGHQVWLALDSLYEIEEASLVFFVDLMFSPAGFVAESSSLANFALKRPNKRFFLIDHHPLPYRRLAIVPNVRAIYRPEVFDCVFGPRSGMMVVAAICERQQADVREIREPWHDLLALGVRRAAAPGGSLGGDALLSLMRNDRWDVLADIGSEESSYHRMVRGRRIGNSPQVGAMAAALDLANGSGERYINDSERKREREQRGSAIMPYDIGAERFSRNIDEPARFYNAPRAAKDLEALVTLLEVAALSLTVNQETTFTIGELLKEARELGGPGITIEAEDVKIVLKKASFLKKAGTRLSLR